MRTDLTLAHIAAVREMLVSEADDDRLLADMIEGETDAYSLVSRLLDAIEREDGDTAALVVQIDAREARRSRCEARKKHLRAAIQTVVEATGLTKITLPEATVSVSIGKPKLSIVSDDAVPEQFQVVKRSPDKRAINNAYADADDLPNWLTREAGTISLTVRRK